jgi:hypothetical protein
MAMRDLPTILEDVRQYLISHGPADDLKSLDDEIKVSTLTGNLWSNVGTWILTFQVYAEYDVVMQDLIEEYIVCCHANGIYPR